MLIVAIHAASPVASGPAEKRSDSTVKPIKVKKLTALPKTTVGIVKSFNVKKTWMIILQQALLNGLSCPHGLKFRCLFAPVFDAAAIFAVGRVKL